MEYNLARSESKAAILAGVAYLFNIISILLVMTFIDSKLFVTGDAIQTANNILENEMLFRVGFVCSIIYVTCFIILPVALYRIFNSTHKGQALTMLILALAGVPVVCVSLLFYYASIIVLRQDYFFVFSSDQLQALSRLFIDLYENGFSLSKIFFGLWLLPLGLLIIRSKILSRFIGILLIIGCCGYVIDFTIIYLLPEIKDYSALVLVPSLIAEIVFSVAILLLGLKSLNKIEK